MKTTIILLTGLIIIPCLAFSQEYLHLKGSVLDKETNTGVPNVNTSMRRWITSIPQEQIYGIGLFACKGKYLNNFNGEERIKPEKTSLEYVLSRTGTDCGFLDKTLLKDQMLQNWLYSPQRTESYDNPQPNFIIGNSYDGIIFIRKASCAKRI